MTVRWLSNILESADDLKNGNCWWPDKNAQYVYQGKIAGTYYNGTTVFAVVALPNGELRPHRISELTVTGF